jgi:hypothetical protein
MPPPGSPSRTRRSRDTGSVRDRPEPPNLLGGTVIERINQPETDDVEGHFQVIDDEGRTTPPPTRLVPVTDEDDAEGHVLDLDIERKR